MRLLRAGGPIVVQAAAVADKAAQAMLNLRQRASGLLPLRFLPLFLSHPKLRFGDEQNGI